MTAQNFNARFSVDSAAFRKALRKFSVEAQQAAWNEGIVDGLSALEGIVKSNIQQKGLIDQGRLLNTWDLKLEGPQGTQSWGKISTNVIYAAIHEYGGIIKPRFASVLAWRDKSSGEWHFAKSVTIHARPYFRPAFDEGGPFVNAKFADAVKRVMFSYGAV